MLQGARQGLNLFQKYDYDNFSIQCTHVSLDTSKCPPHSFVDSNFLQYTSNSPAIQNPEKCVKYLNSAWKRTFVEWVARVRIGQKRQEVVWVRAHMRRSQTSQILHAHLQHLQITR